MNKLSLFFALLLSCLVVSCGHKANENTAGQDSTFVYAKHITIKYDDGFRIVELADPWNKGKVLHKYILVDHKDSARMQGKLPEGTIVYTPLRRAVIFTAAHANLAEWLHAGKSIAGVAEPKYMHIPDIQRRLRETLPANGKNNTGNPIIDVGNSMKPDIEKIISIHADAIFLSPFENSGGYDKLEEINIPIIECADYMETSALGRAEWMKFYGMLLGKEDAADSLFNVVETNYDKLKTQAKAMKGKPRKILPDRKTGSSWYVPGGQSSVGLLYKDAGGIYALAKDNHSGSIPLPFETILSTMGDADFWTLSYNGDITKEKLLAEYDGYKALKPFKTGEIYGCKVDTTPYFEEVSWRPDWLLSDLIKLFHPNEFNAKLRYYHKIK